MFNTLLNSLGFGQLKGGVATMTKGASWLPCFCPLIRGLVQVLFFVVKLEKSNTGREGLVPSRGFVPTGDAWPD